MTSFQRKRIVKIDHNQPNEMKKNEMKKDGEN